MIPPALAALLYRVLAYAAIAVALYGAGRFHQMLIAERARDVATISAWEEGDRHVATYFKKSIALADTADVMRRLQQRVCYGKPLRDPERADGTPGADADDRSTDEIGTLADELKRAQRNRFKLEAVQAALKPQIAEQKSWYEFWK